MSHLTAVSSATSTSQTIRLPQTASIIEKASVKLERVRGEILKTQTFLAALPEATVRSILPIINEFVGADEVQEAQLSEDLAHVFEGNFKLSIFYRSFALMRKCMLFAEEFSKIPVSQSTDKTSGLTLAKACHQNIQKQIASLPFSHSSVYEVSLSAESTGIFFSKVIETLDRFTEEFVTPERRAALKGSREKLSEINGEALLLPVRHLYAKYGQKKTLMKSDGPFLKEWVKDIVSTQKKYATAIPPVVYEEGDSQGLSFSIKKEGQIRGYLHGTMHSMDYMKLYELSRISKIVEQRLYECVILSTEIAVNEEDDLFTNAIFSSEVGIPSSVESALIARAYHRGIANLGIDAEERNELISSLPASLPKKFQEGIELLFLEQKLKILKDPNFQNLFSSYRRGDLEGYQAAMLKVEETHPESEKAIENISARNLAMAENIDRLIKACEEVGTEIHEPHLKCFFAVGVSHLIHPKEESNTVVKLLVKKGYLVEFLQP